MRRTCEWEKEGSFDCLASQRPGIFFKGAQLSRESPLYPSRGIRVTSSHLPARVTTFGNGRHHFIVSQLSRNGKPGAGLLDLGQERISGVKLELTKKSINVQ